MTEPTWETCRECHMPASLVLVSTSGDTIMGSCARHLNRLVTWWLEDDLRVEVYTVARWAEAVRFAGTFGKRRRKKRLDAAVPVR